MISRQLVFFLCLLLLQMIGPASTYADSRDERELAMARHAVLGSLAVSAKLGSGLACSKEPYSCVVVDPVDLSLALIAEKRSDDALRVLASLLKYQLDGSAATDYTCHVLEKGASVKPFLVRLDANSMRADCEAELGALVNKHPQLFSGVSVESVCTAPTEIQRKRKNLLKAVNANRKCESGW